MSRHHLSPIHSWKRIFPSVVSASKSGAMSPSWIAMVIPPLSRVFGIRCVARPPRRVNGRAPRVAAPGGATIQMGDAGWHDAHRVRDGQAEALLLRLKDRS